jgi:two-component system, OmpR family, phosphate regulon sensor histidine kinase PhoR
MALRWVRGSGAVGEQNPERELRDADDKEQSLQSALALLTDEYTALLDRCGAAAVVLDQRGVVLRSNDHAQRLLGVHSTALSGLKLLEATLSDELDDLFREAQNLGFATRREVRAPSAGGSVLEVEVTAIRTPGHDAPRYLLIARDVTTRRRLELMRRDFVANVSHELRTPLASIRAMAETLQDGALTDPNVADKFLGTIVKETDRLARIAEDLLVLSDAESHQPDKQAVDLSEMVELVVSRSRPQAEKAGLTMTDDIERGLGVQANRDQIEQVLVNLVDNAIKYTGEGGSVHVSAARSGDRVAVHVEDSGIGIMSEHLPRIFERFYRVDKARSRQSGGTGLGLSIVRHIVEAHGGTVSVKSEYNRGSTFSFGLPAEVGPADTTGYRK